MPWVTFALGMLPALTTGFGMAYTVEMLTALLWGIAIHGRVHSNRMERSWVMEGNILILWIAKQRDPRMEAVTIRILLPDSNAPIFVRLLTLLRRDGTRLRNVIVVPR